MISEEIMRSLTVKTPSKIVLLVLDGVGGLRVDGRTECGRIWLVAIWPAPSN